ncbi:MAG: mandelate racemase/muconate lactonizing enzyme family protein [Bryobacteraceae bacterium]
MRTAMIARRSFLGASGAALFPASVRAQTAAVAGVKPADLPSFTIKEVKVYATASGRLASIVTEGGVEGICTLQTSVFHANWDNSGWLDYAKRALAGKNALDHLQFTSQYLPVRRHYGQPPQAAAIDICLWDLLGKATGLPVYRILGAYKDRVLAYASSQHLQTKTPDPYVEAALKAKAEGFQAFKINPPPVGADGDGHYRLDMEICKAVRKAVGDDFMLMHHAVGNYTRSEAMEAGRLLDELHYRGYEDPLPSTDVEGLAQLCQELRTPVIVGEFMFSLYDYPEYIRRGAADTLRFVVDNVGGITPGLKIGVLAECHGMECMPHGVGNVLHQAAHLHCELAMPNSAFVEVPYPQGARDAQPYMKDIVRIAPDGYVHAPSKPGLGYEIDRAALDKAIVRIER